MSEMPGASMDYKKTGMGLELLRNTPLSSSEQDALMAAELLIGKRVSYPPAECFALFDERGVLVLPEFAIVTLCVSRIVEIEWLKGNDPSLSRGDQMILSNARHIYQSELQRLLATWFGHGHDFWKKFHMRIAGLLSRTSGYPPERKHVREVYGLYLIPLDVLREVTNSPHRLELELLEQSLVSALTGMISDPATGLKYFRHAMDLSKRLQNAPFVQWCSQLAQDSISDNETIIT